jgi:type VI secretion system protein ImpH
MSSASIPSRPQIAPEPREAQPTSAPAAAIPGSAAIPKAQNSGMQSLLSQLSEKPWLFDFYNTVRRLENLARHRPPVGANVRTQDDIVRFGQAPSMAFAPSTLTACHLSSEGKPPRLMVQFFGLTGPFGPMPLHITEYLHQRQKHHSDFAGSRFFDLFNHRMTALFYRAWATNQQTVSYERGLPMGTNDRTDFDRFGAYVASLMGRGMASFRQRDALPDLAKLSFAGLLASQTKNADGLSGMLMGFFDVPVAIEQFIGQWVEIPTESWCRLGESPETCTLGSSVVVGSRIWDCQQKFRIRFGPMDFRHYQHFLPGHPGLERLKAIVRNYVGDELGWDLQLLLRADQVPTACLGRVGQLGWTSWMGNSVHDRQAENLILQPAA